MDSPSSDDDNTVLVFKATGREIEPTIYVYFTDTVLSVKEDIESQIDVVVSRQTLMHGDQTLENDRTLESYGFVPDQEDDEAATDLKLIVPSLTGVFPISLKDYVTDRVPDASDKHVVGATEALSVFELKRQINSIWDVPISEMSLYFKDAKMADHKTLYDYYIGPNAEIEVKSS